MKKQQPSRDTVTTIQNDGSRFFLHPADVHGLFTLLRRVSAIGLILIYVLLPWIKINGYPAVFLDVMHLRFHFFGLTLASQDLWIGFFIITGLGFFLFYISALFGRIWCGWACPQTVFLEHVFRRIERWIEGDATKRKRLDAAPFTGHKIMLRIIKHSIFFLIAALIAHVFLSYFIPIPLLYEWMQDSPLEHWSAFLFMAVVTLVLYFNFSWFREQLCLVICPYGRLQSTLQDDDSIVIGYDETRGNPPGKANDPDSGDCIDCQRCVQVCPTGIDIRQGLQIECIGCAACIDACDDIMAKLNRPKGLVRYDSFNGFSGKKTKILRPRIFLYTALMFLGIGVFSYAVTHITPATMTTVRMQGSPYFVDDLVIRNQFMLRLINKDNAEISQFVLEAETPAEGFSWAGFDKAMEVAPNGERLIPLILLQSREHYEGPFEVILVVKDITNNDYELTEEVEFLGPDPRLLKEDAFDK